MTIPPRHTLGSDLSISRIVTGMWQIADMERDGTPVDPVETAEAMKPYVDAGLTTFDMADHYGSAEMVAGQHRGVAAQNVQYLTKWVPEPGSGSEEQVRAAVQRSLDRLGTDSLDLLQYHAWRYSDPAWLDHLFWLDDLRQQGLIRHLGLTNFDTEHLRVVLRSGIPVVSNQVSFSLLDRRGAHGMTELCETEGIGLLAFGTVAGGLLTERWLGAKAPGPESMETWSHMKYRRFVETAGGWDAFQGLLSTVDAVARRLGMSMANVATRWVLDQPGVAAVIIGARLGASDHIEDNVRAFDFELDDRARVELAEAAGGLDAIPGDCGDEYRHAPFLTASGDLSHHVDSFPDPYPVRADEAGRARADSGTIWEELAGFSRGFRVGNRILVSGTTATHGSRLIGGNDAGAQATFCLDKIQGAIESLGGSLEEVVRTRVYVTDAGDAEAVSRAHGRRFGRIRPANTLVQAGLIGDGYLVEMEAEAVVGDVKAEG